MQVAMGSYLCASVLGGLVAGSCGFGDLRAAVLGGLRAGRVCGLGDLRAGNLWVVNQTS